MLRFPLTALTALAATAALAVPAQAAPDWLPATDVGDANGSFTAPVVGYADGGVEIEAHLKINSGKVPFDVDLVAAKRQAGSAPATELTIPTTSAGVPADVALDVAPSGAAVLVWKEIDPKTAEGVQRFRAAYRDKSGTWEQPVLLGTDALRDDAIFPQVTASIGDDGTAAAGMAHLEPNSPGELETDGRVDVSVHAASGAWDNGTRLSPPDVSADFVEVGVDGDGVVTAAYRQRTSEGSVSGISDDDTTAIVRRYSPSNGIWNAAEDVAGARAFDDAGAVHLDVAPSGRAVLAYQFGAKNTTGVTFAARRASSTGAFGTPVPVDGNVASFPIGTGIAPDGTTYVLRAANGGQRNIGVARASAAGSFSTVEQLAPTKGFPSGAIAFRGGDAFLGWTDSTSTGGVVQAAIWPAGAVRPDAARDLDTGHPVDDLEQVASDRDGSVVALWGSGVLSARSATFDGGAPALTGAEVPSSGDTGAALTMSASFADLWSPLDGQPRWDFGDGASATGGSVSHAYSAPGAYTVTVSSRDGRGNERSRAFPVVIATASGPAPAPPAAPADSVKPTAKLKLPAKRIRGKRSAWQTLKGTVADAQPSSGIARVEVSAFRPAAKRKFLALSGRRFRSVSKTKALTAFTKVSPRGQTWKLKLPKLTRGTWTFRVRAIDNAGNVSKTASQKVRLR